MFRDSKHKRTVYDQSDPHLSLLLQAVGPRQVALDRNGALGVLISAH